MKRRILIAVIVALLAGTGYAVWHFNNKEEENGKRLTLYGNVDIREVNLGFRVGGRVAQMRFEEGDSVHAGDVMAVLDKAPFQHDLALALAQLETRRANYQKMQAGSRPEDIAQARARVAEQEAGLKNAERIYERQKSLLKKDVASEQAYEDALANKSEAKARLASARAALDLALAGFRKEDIRAAEGELHAAEAQVEQARTRLQDTEVIAPADGTVLTRVVEPGAIVAAGATVYSVSLGSPVWVRTYVSEPDLGRVHPGMPVLVSTDGGNQYHGHVGFISPDAEFTPKTVQTTALRTDLVYRVRIIVDDPDNKLRRGMPVTVNVTAGTAAAPQ
jgi:HlyD family secretion protein